MAQASLCPVCGGEGKVERTISHGTSTWIGAVSCHGCGGKGWVEAQDSPPLWSKLEARYVVDPTDTTDISSTVHYWVTS